MDEAKILGSKSDKFVGTDADLLAIWGWVLFRHPAEEKLLANLDVDVSTIGDEGFSVLPPPPFKRKRDGGADGMCG